MALFMTRKKREQIGDEIDDLLMRQYHHRCKLEEAQQAGNEERVQYEKNKKVPISLLRSSDAGHARCWQCFGRIWL